MLVDLLPLIAILVCTILVSLSCRTEEIHYDDSVIPFADEWTTSEGETVSLEDLPIGDVEVSHSLNGIDIENKRLCFKSTHTYIKAKFDGKVTYTYEPVQSQIIGKSYGMYVHLIPIPEGASTVTLELHPLYNGTSAAIEYTTVEDAGMFMADLYHNGLPSFAICMIITLFGVLMLIMGVPTLLMEGDNTINFFSLGTFAILVGIWTMNETMILQIFTQHPEIVRYTDYMCLTFIAYPPVSFVASATKQRSTTFLPVLMTLCTGNFILTNLFSLMGICDMRTMLKCSHLNILIALFMASYLMINAILKKTVEKTLLHTIVIGLTPAIIGVLVDMIRFQVLPENHYDASLFTKFGVVIFIGMMGLHLMREQTRKAVSQGQEELLRKLAYTDSLTELANRTSFKEKEDQIRRELLGCIIVQLDINCLKTVNDVYGHAEGDRHIVTAAHIISESFRQLGTSYRTGGDEFIVITGECTIKDVDKALEKMEDRANIYNKTENPPVPLRIAYGYAVCDQGADMIKAAEELADQRMYEKKKRMKDMD